MDALMTKEDVSMVKADEVITVANFAMIKEDAGFGRANEGFGNLIGGQ